MLLEELTELSIHFSSIDATCSSGSVIAATLANGGICPLTGNFSWIEYFVLVEAGSGS